MAKTNILALKHCGLQKTYYICTPKLIKDLNNEFNSRN